LDEVSVHSANHIMDGGNGPSADQRGAE
jgi:hypothetical protein